MAPSSKNKKGRNSAEDTSPFRSRVPKSWSSHSQDGIELKAYIELGFCENFGINDILHKYRQFEGYDRKTLYNAMKRYQNQAEKNRDNRMNLSNGCK